MPLAQVTGMLVWPHPDLLRLSGVTQPYNCGSQGSWDKEGDEKEGLTLKEQREEHSSLSMWVFSHSKFFVNVSKMHEHKAGKICGACL